MPRTYKRKLSDVEERKVILTTLCGLPVEYICDRWDITENTKFLITSKRSKKLKDPLIEFYRKTNVPERIKNSAHLYLSFNDRDVEKKDLVDKDIDKDVYELVFDNIYKPVIEHSINSTSLDRITAPTTGLERLLEKIFGEFKTENYVQSLLTDQLYDLYKRNSSFTIHSLSRIISNLLLEKIKGGAFSITKLKSDIIEEALDSLSERERDILNLRFKEQKTLRECAEKHGVSHEMIRYIQLNALKKLDRPKTKRLIKMFSKPVTDQEVSEHISNLGLKRLNEYNIEEILNMELENLSLSTRAYKRLIACNIRSVKDLIERRASDFLRVYHFGPKSLKEVQDALSKISLSLAQD